MGTAIETELREFTDSLFQKCGGLVDWPEDAPEGVAVVPPEVARFMHLPGETFPVSLQAGPERLHIGLAGDYLELAGTLLADCVPRSAALEVPERYLKRGDLQEAVDRAYTWTNARVRVGNSTPMTVEYHRWWFHASLRSEDWWESPVSIELNSASLAEVQLPDPFELSDARLPEEGPTLPVETFSRAMDRGRRRTLQLAAGFLERLEARRDRDRKRLREYYGALSREATATPRRGATPDPARNEERKRAVQLELQRKLLELDERYAVDARLAPIALLRTTVQVLAVELLVQRKTARRTHTTYWNPLLKQLEPLACHHCGTSGFTVGFSNETVHPLCMECLNH